MCVHCCHGDGGKCQHVCSLGLEKVVFKMTDVSVHSEMSVNGRLYVIPQDHPDKILVSHLVICP